MDMTFKLNKGNAIVMIAIAALFMVVRLATLGGNDDPTLEAAVRDRLKATSVGQVAAELQYMRETGDMSGNADVPPRADAQVLEIVGIDASSPLFSGSSNERVIVHVRYRLPGAGRLGERYLEFRHGAVGSSWQYRGAASALGYYLNLF